MWPIRPLRPLIVDAKLDEVNDAIEIVEADSANKAA